MSQFQPIQTRSKSASLNRPLSTYTTTSSSSSSLSSTSAMSAMDAPLSSPSLAQQQAQYSSSQAQYFPSQQQPQAPQQYQQQQQQPGGGAGATSPFLRDFNLVAEAAKRAQMACLMRDLEAVGL